MEKAMEINIEEPNISPPVGHADDNQTQETPNPLTIVSTDQSPAEPNGKSTEETANTFEAVPCEVEVTETVTQTEVKSAKIESVRSIEMDAISTADAVIESAPESMTESINNQQETINAGSINIAVNGSENESANGVQQQENIEEAKSTSANKETVENDPNMETQDAESKSKAETSKANPVIGALGLLNQYSSSLSSLSSLDSSTDSSDSDAAGATAKNDDAGSSATSESETDDNESDIDSVSYDSHDSNDNIYESLDVRDYVPPPKSEFRYKRESDVSDVESIEIPDILLHDEDWELEPLEVPSDDDGEKFVEYKKFLAMYADYKKTKETKETKGEVGMNDLPPIAELTITVPESDCVEFGKVSNIVDTLVLVESKPGVAAVDIDTVLFLEKGNRTLGQVFDVMGNVASPIYCVRFNTTQDITANNITVGLQVYVAPQTEYTNFIVLANLMKEKGCDASWENDNEAPDDCNEFSDDEEERLHRRTKNQRQRNTNRSVEPNDQLPNKVTVKMEPNVSNHPNRRPNRFNNRGKHTNKPPQRFYKDNRGYANPGPSSSYHPHQRMQPVNHNHSWHTAQMHGMPQPSTSSQPMHPPYAPPPYGAPMPNHGQANVYPNPFAFQQNFGGPFNLQAFPPLPPPNGSIPAHHQPPQLRPPSTSFNRNRKPGPFQHHHPKPQ